MVGYNGQIIKAYDDFSKAYKADPDGEVIYLRMEDGSFVEYKSKIEAVDITGFLDLTE